MEQLHEKIISVYEENENNLEKITAILLDFMKLDYEIDTESSHLLIITEYLFYLRNTKSPILGILTSFISKNIGGKIYTNIAPSYDLLKNNYTGLSARLKFEAVEKVRKLLDFYFTIVDIHKMIKLLEDDILFCLKYRIQKLREETLTLSEAKEKYKLTTTDLDNISYYEHVHSLYNKVCKIYVVEDIKDYINTKYGQKKLDEKRLKSEARREKLRENKKIKDEKQTAMENERRNIVIQLLGENGYYYDDDNHFASDFIYNNDQKYEPEKILELAKKLNDMKVKKIERRELLTDELEKYGYSIRNDSFLCNEYIEYGNRDLIYVVNVMREMEFLMNHTDYQVYWKKKCLEYYDGVLRRVVGIRKYRSLINRPDDIYKTYAIEKYLEKVKEAGGKISECHLSPNIVWRIDEIEKSMDINKKIEEDLEKERDERKKRNIQDYLNKRSKKNKKVVDI